MQHPAIYKSFISKMMLSIPNRGIDIFLTQRLKFSNYFQYFIISLFFSRHPALKTLDMPGKQDIACSQFIKTNQRFHNCIL